MMVRDRVLRWCTREKIIMGCGCFALLLGAILPWYQLPPQLNATFEVNLAILTVERCIALLLSCLGLFFMIWSTLRHCPRTLFWGGLLTFLLFPYLLTTWLPNVSFLGHSYESQSRRITSHVELNFADVQSQWKQNILLDRTYPVSSIVNLPIQDSRFFQLPALDQFIMDGLGYNTNFFEFLGKGWGWSVIGVSCSLLGLYLAWEEGVTYLWKDLVKLSPWGGVLLGVVITSLVAPNILNQHLDTLFVQGRYREVLTLSETLTNWYPPFRGDEAFLKRLAEAGFYSNEPNPALIAFAKGLEQYRKDNFLQAETEFRRSLELDPTQFFVRGYLATAILNRGIQHFNDSAAVVAPMPPPAEQQRGTMIDLCNQVLEVFPSHLEALYYLMLSHVLNSDFSQSATVAEQIIATQKYSQNPSMALLGQAHLHLAWADYQNGNLTEAWKRYGQALDPGTWKQNTTQTSQSLQGGGYEP